MVGLYRDPRGENIFITKYESESMHRPGSTIHSSMDLENVEPLRRRIVELENQLTEMVCAWVCSAPMIIRCGLKCTLLICFYKEGNELSEELQLTSCVLKGMFIDTGLKHKAFPGGGAGLFRALVGSTQPTLAWWSRGMFLCRSTKSCFTVCVLSGSWVLLLCEWWLYGQGCSQDPTQKRVWSCTCWHHNPSIEVYKLLCHRIAIIVARWQGLMAKHSWFVGWHLWAGVPAPCAPPLPTLVKV